MSGLLVQAHLRGGGTIEALAERSIKARRHGRYENLVLLKYGIEAPFMDPLVRECRGLVLDEATNWCVVSRAFDKFGNHGEGYVPPIDWSTARVQEKLDGSLCVLYHYDGAWHVATTGTPDACGEVHDAGGTFADYFWSTFAAEGGKLPGRHLDHLCFAFELMGPANRIVVVHEKPWLRLLAVRERDSGQEGWPEEFAEELGIPAVRSFPLSSLDEIVASFEHISPVAQEGYVVVDGSHQRVKIKHPGYVALHHAKDGMGPKAFVQIARTGEVSEVVAAFPEFRPLIEHARARYERLLSSVTETYGRIAGLVAQKDFAAEALKTPHSPVLFQMRKGVAADAFLRDVAVEKLMAWMDAA